MNEGLCFLVLGVIFVLFVHMLLFFARHFIGNEITTQYRTSS